jgi:hypothetical protein
VEVFAPDKLLTTERGGFARPYIHENKVCKIFLKKRRIEMETIMKNRKKMTLGEFVAELENDWGFGRTNGTQSVAETLMGIIPPSDSEKKVDVTFALWSDQQEAGMRFVMRWYVDGYVPCIRGNKPRCIELTENGFIVSSNTKLV